MDFKAYHKYLDFKNQYTTIKEWQRSNGYYYDDLNIITIYGQFTFYKGLFTEYNGDYEVELYNRKGKFITKVNVMDILWLKPIHYDLYKGSK